MLRDDKHCGSTQLLAASLGSHECEGCVGCSTPFAFTRASQTDYPRVPVIHPRVSTKQKLADEGSVTAAHTHVSAEVDYT